MRSPKRSFLLCLVLVMVGMHAASADDVGDREARTRFLSAKALVSQNKLADAYDEFARGYAASGRPAFLFNMAETARALGRLDTARADYERYLAADPHGPYAAVATRRLAALPPAPQEPEPAPAPAPAPEPALNVPAPVSRPMIPPPAQVAASRQNLTTEPAAEPIAVVETPRPLWKRWPLWAGVGLALVGGVVAAYVLVDRSAPGCGNDMMCVDLRGRP
jgi:hypothetical protein